MSLKRPLGLIAGSGELPMVFARGARRAGRKVFAVALKGLTSPRLERLVDDLEWIGVGNLGGLVKVLKRAGVEGVVMEGQVKLASVFSVRPDLLGLRVLAGLKVRSGEAILRAVGDVLSKNGIRLLDCRTHMAEVLAPKRGPLSPGRGRDLALGLKAARALAAMEAGQTAVVKNGVIVALEGIEGTDACLRRGAALAGRGCSAVKVSSPRGDFRFDVPTLGPRTLRVLKSGAYRAMAVESGKAFLIGGESLIEKANGMGINIYGL